MHVTAAANPRISVHWRWTRSAFRGVALAFFVCLPACGAASPTVSLGGCFLNGIDEAKRNGKASVICDLQTQSLIVVTPAAQSQASLVDAGLSEDAALAVSASTSRGTRWCILVERPAKDPDARPGFDADCTETSLGVQRLFVLKATRIVAEFVSDNQQVTLSALRSEQ